MEYTRHYVWSLLLRVIHWILTISTVALLITGFYIHYPWSNNILEGAGRFSMATMRAIHFHAGFYFSAAVAARCYLLLFGNKFERFWDFFPVTIKNIKQIPHTIAYYLYLTDRYDHHLGHNPWAGVFFFATYTLSLIQIFSGFCLLYPESAFWQGWGLKIIGTQQQIRFSHYLVTWYFIIFSFVHTYVVIWNDIKTREGLVSSIFNGRKYAPGKN